MSMFWQHGPGEQAGGASRAGLLCGVLAWAKSINGSSYAAGGIKVTRGNCSNWPDFKLKFI